MVTFDQIDQPKIHPKTGKPSQWLRFLFLFLFAWVFLGAINAPDATRVVAIGIAVLGMAYLLVPPPTGL